MKFLDSGAFQTNMQMLSHDKIIFHMLFGAFHAIEKVLTKCFCRPKAGKYVN